MSSFFFFIAAERLSLEPLASFGVDVIIPLPPADDADAAAGAADARRRKEARRLWNGDRKEDCRLKEGVDEEVEGDSAGGAIHRMLRRNEELRPKKPPAPDVDERLCGEVSIESAVSPVQGKMQQDFLFFLLYR